MRSASLLFAGLLILGAGVVVVASDLAVRWWLGVPLILVGLAVKTTGFLLTDDPVRTTRRQGRRVTTLDGRVVEVPRPGLPAAPRGTTAFRRAS